MREQVVIPAGEVSPTSPAYRYRPLGTRRAVNQLEKLTVTFGDEVIENIRNALDQAAYRAAEKRRDAMEAWQSDPTQPEPPPISKARLDLDFAESLFAIFRGVQGALTGDTLSTIQIKHFYESEVEIEVDGKWKRLVDTRASESVDPKTQRKTEATELDCDGYDDDLPIEDAFPLWWTLLKVNVVPLFQAGRRLVERMLAKPTTGSVSSQPSSEPTDTSSQIG